MSSLFIIKSKCEFEYLLSFCYLSTISAQVNRTLPSAQPTDHFDRKMIAEGSVFLLIVTILVVLVIRRRRRREELLVPDWSPDVVYLAQFPPSPRVRSISPFSLKLETWLRLAHIPYKNIYTRTFSKTSHTIPYIELNGRQMADSNRIIETLRSHFQPEVDQDLTDEQIAAAHVTTSMIENHTAQVRHSQGHDWKQVDTFCSNILFTSFERRKNLFFSRENSR